MDVCISDSTLYSLILFFPTSVFLLQSKITRRRTIATRNMTIKIKCLFHETESGREFREARAGLCDQQVNIEIGRVSSAFLNPGGIAAYGTSAVPATTDDNDHMTFVH